MKTALHTVWIKFSKRNVTIGGEYIKLVSVYKDEYHAIRKIISQVIWKRVFENKMW